MTVARTRSLGAVFAAAACATALSVTPAFQSGVRALMAEVSLVAGENVGWIMGGTGNPIPDQEYLNDVEAALPEPVLRIHLRGLETPEQFCPIVCSTAEPNLGFGDSVNIGVTDLHNVVGSAATEDDNVAVLGYSQSATVASQWMNELSRTTRQTWTTYTSRCSAIPTARSAAYWTVSSFPTASANTA